MAWGLCLCQTLHGQQRAPDGALRFERLDSRAGLSHNTVLSILQDHQGFLWIGTSDGLNRYDGYQFTVYRNDPFDETSLSNNAVYKLLEDRQGTLWAGTSNGLDRFDRRTEQFIRYDLLTDSLFSSPEQVQLPSMNGLLEDAAGRVWATTGYGVYRYDPQADEMKMYAPHFAAADLRHRRVVEGLFKDRTGTVWVSTDGPTYTYNPEADRFTPMEWAAFPGSASVQYEDEALRLWAAYQGKLYTVDRERGRLSPLPLLPEDQIFKVFLEDRRGTRWIGTHDGLYQVDPLRNQRQFLRLDTSPGAYLSNNIQSLYEDQAGTLWIGALSGLFRLDPYAKPFLHLQHNPTDPNSLSSNTVMAVLEDDEGFLWVGTLGGGLNRVDLKTGTTTQMYRHRAEDPNGLCNDLIWSLYVTPTSPEMLWIGTDQGLCALNRRTG